MFGQGVGFFIGGAFALGVGLKTIRGHSSMAEQLDLLDDGGSIPTCPLQPDRPVVERCSLRNVQGIVERVHYSHSIFGVTATQCYLVKRWLDTWPYEDICGGAIFGKPAAFNVSRKYDNGEPLLELRRFVLEDYLPHNSESKYLAVMLRDLKRQGIKRILTYADPAQGHAGTIYKATGFTFMGKTSSRKHVFWKGKKYPDRNIHQTNFPFHKEIRAALESGDATHIAVPGKLIFLKVL